MSGEARACATCGAAFSGRRSSRYCSRRCRDRAARASGQSGGVRVAILGAGSQRRPVVVRCEDCGAELMRTWRPAVGPLRCRRCYRRLHSPRVAKPPRLAPRGPCATCGCHAERLVRERRTGMLRCAPCQMALNQQRYRATHQRANDAAAVRRDDEARAQAASTGAWLPVEALQRAISDASDQRTARDAYAGLRRRAGVRSPEELVMHLTRRLFVAAIFAVPEDEALDEREPKAEVAPRVVRPLVNRAPRSRAGSHALHEALRQAEAAGA